MNLLKRAIRKVVPETIARRVRLAGISLGADAPNHYYERSGREEMIRKAFSALSFNGISGDYLEFGSHGGMTFDIAHKASRKANFRCKLWSFDSFGGLPQQSDANDHHPQWIKGEMRTELSQFRSICRRNGIPEADYEVIPGFYEETIGREEQINMPLPEDVAFAYVDCDLYSSTKTVLQFLSRRMKHGAIVAFDDYFCYSKNTISGERLACLEFLGEDTRFHFSPFTQFGWHGMSFIVEDRSLLPTPVLPIS